MGVSQDLLVRVYQLGDVFFAGQEGGFTEEEVVDAVRQIQGLPNVEVVGVTSFPVVSYSYREPLHMNPNMATIMRAADSLQRELGIQIKQINAPSNTSSQVFPLLKAAGATHVEPGTGLLGSSAGHLINGDAWVEKPSYVYVSEISHHWQGRAYAFAGGLWSLMRGGAPGPGWPRNALVGSDPTAVFDNPLPYEHVDQIIDYHIPLEHGERARVGDTVVMGIPTQAQMTRSHTAAVSGTSTGHLKVWGIFDHATTQLDADYNPVAPAEVRQQIDRLVELYAPAPALR
jgi:predicted amino acid racemase